jgi:hypothetical protein
MATQSRPHATRDSTTATRDSTTPTRAWARLGGLLARGALALLMATWLLWVPLTSVSDAEGVCLVSGSAGCASTLAIAHAADSQEEIEDEEAEREEAEEEAATAQAEAEEKEEGSGSADAESASVQSGSTSTQGTSPKAPVISRLTLTAKATAALRHRGPPASAVGFSFMLSTPAKMQVTLVMQTSSHGHKHWKRLPDSLTTRAGKGHGRRNLTGHNRLVPGHYRLTVRPLRGRSRSIYLTTYKSSARG